MNQSPELGSGAGFTFEDSVVARYLTALLQEGYAPGIPNGVVVRVAQQQRAAGEPLDDAIVDFKFQTGELVRLSLQAKSSLTISAAESNGDFRSIVRDCWLTLKKGNFRLGKDRYGAVAREVNAQKARDFRQIAELARASIRPSEFLTRFEGDGSASSDLRAIKSAVLKILEETKGGKLIFEEEHDFFRHLVLIEVDAMHEGDKDTPVAINELKHCLHSSTQDQATGMWLALKQIAREGGGKAAVHDRSNLICALAPHFKLAARPSLRSDLQQIEILTHQWLQDIESDVGGVRVPRQALNSKLEEALRANRIVQIKGLPGSGKSVLMRDAVEAELQNGPVLLLKSGRLEGTGWASFAHATGLSTAPLAELLVELGATGSSTIFIDGIDRIENRHQPIVSDLVKGLLSLPTLKNSRIVMSLRDVGIEPLRNWLGSVLEKTTIGTVDVEGLDDEAAKLLADAKPHLKPLLFGPMGVQQIVRRPFFAKILNQNFGAQAGDENFRPQSEIDLISNWWLRGGYDSSGQSVFDRQRALIELGRLKARHLEQEISVRHLSPATSLLVEHFAADGIIHHVSRGHTIRFAHDIFFEWAFFHVLLDESAGWLDEIRACGEPPAVARVVELLSQHVFGNPSDWSATLERIEASDMRSQWMRAWLLAPVLATDFTNHRHDFAAVVEANDCRLLQRALVWFQAERTTPNPNVLQGASRSAEERVRIADLLGWPSDFAAWGRFLTFVLDRIGAVPVPLRADVFAVFEVWQNALVGIRNDVSNRLLDMLASWLIEIEQESDTRERLLKPSSWEGFKGLKIFRNNLVRLIFHSSTIRPDLSGAYLDVLLKRESLRDERFEELLTFSGFIAVAHGEQLVELTLKHLIGELPLDQLAREREESRRNLEYRQRIEAKPKEKRTRQDELILQNSFPRLGHSYGHHDWEQLAVDRESGNYFPASPLREPFHSLFKHAPDQALRLIKALSNHAIIAWRQLHRVAHDKRGTPIPLSLNFPWGTQEFWGGPREYLWSRALWGPQPIMSAYLALEDWAFGEVEKGCSADEIIRQIVEGNECIAVLGVAAALAAESQTVSETVFPLVTSQRLLSADEERMQHDFTDKQSSLIGFKGQTDLAHIQAVQRINNRAVRGKGLSQQIGRYFIFADTEMRDRTEAAIKAFRDDLPYQYEEWRKEPGATEALLAEAEEYEEQIKLENYRRFEIKDEPDTLVIAHVNPRATTPEGRAELAAANRWIRRASLWPWAANYFEKGVLGEGWTIQSAVQFARDLETDPIADDRIVEDAAAGQGAVAAVAAMVLADREGLPAEDLAWARNILRQAVNSPESRDGLWTPVALIPWHPAAFAARGLARDVLAGTASADARKLLLRLVAHPLEEVAQVTVGECLRLWQIDRRLSWAALHLFLSLCAVPPRQAIAHNEPYHTEQVREDAIQRALEASLQTGEWEPLPVAPTPWINTGDKGQSERSWDDNGYVEPDDMIDPTETWVRNPIWWNTRQASKAMGLVPVDKMLSSDARRAFESYVIDQLQWTIIASSPPWANKGRRDDSTGLFEWLHMFGQLLGKAVGHYPLGRAHELFLKPIFDQSDEHCWELLQPLADMYLCVYVYDAEVMSEDAPALLQLCLDRLLHDRAFSVCPVRVRGVEWSGLR